MAFPANPMQIAVVLPRHNFITVMFMVYYFRIRPAANTLGVPGQYAGTDFSPQRTTQIVHITGKTHAG